MGELVQKAAKAKEASKSIAIASTEAKNEALLEIARQLVEQAPTILAANEQDIQAGIENGIQPSLLDRLRLTQERIEEMALGLRQIVSLDDPIGEMIEEWERPNRLRIQQARVPLGVIGMIYEARPNVTVDAAGLCLKTGNAVLLRGSSTALHSNMAIVRVIHDALASTSIPVDAIQLLEDTSRETARNMFRLTEYLDVLIPRGGAKLIASVIAEASVPVIETGVGNCHVYIDDSADRQMAIEIVLNGKTQRPSVCNAIETILVHQAWAEQHLTELASKLEEKGVELRGSPEALQLIPHMLPATEEDWMTEYLDSILAVRVVADVEEAIGHIDRYGTKHSEAIVSETVPHVERFLQSVDAAAVYHNASTRFTDGFAFGFGAEIGISTQKLHVRGPMGLKALTSSKYIVRGTGQVR